MFEPLFIEIFDFFGTSTKIPQRFLYMWGKRFNCYKLWMAVESKNKQINVQWARIFHRLLGNIVNAFLFKYLFVLKKV